MQPITAEPWVIDSDTHISEPADLWTSRVAVSAPWRDALPQVRRNEQRGRLEWYVGGEMVSTAPAGAVAGSQLTPPSAPRGFEEAHPGAFQVDDRVQLMDEEGVWAQVLFPNIGGFGNEGFLKIGDPTIRLRCVQAYNDFLVEWTEKHRQRFVLVCATPFWDIDECVKEIRRSWELGHRAVLFSGKPDLFWGQPHLADPYWDPVWRTADELNLPIAFHVGATDPTGGWQHRGYQGLPARTRFTANTLPLFLGNAQTIVDLIFGGVAQRFPNLKFVSVESGMGWVLFLLEAMDYQYHEHRIWESSPELDLLPSEYFRRQMYVSFWFERLAPKLILEEVGFDNVMFETDFPHPTSLWPPSVVRAQVEEALAGWPPDVHRKVFWQNAADVYQVQPPSAAWLSRRTNGAGAP